MLFSSSQQMVPCRVGKGAGPKRIRVHARKYSAVPTRSHIQADEKDSVGTAHDRLDRNGNALPAPLPTLRSCRFLQSEPEHVEHHGVALLLELGGVDELGF